MRGIVPPVVVFLAVLHGTLIEAAPETFMGDVKAAKLRTLFITVSKSPSGACVPILGGTHEVFEGLLRNRNTGAETCMNDVVILGFDPKKERIHER